jgi:hypothetical protein
MCKWRWKIESGAGPWQDFMRRKYLGGAGILYSKKIHGDSSLWSDMMQVKTYICVGGECRLVMVGSPVSGLVLGVATLL